MSFRGSTRVETKPKITAWSYSRLKCWLQCPLKAKLLYIDKLSEPESPQMLAGHVAHKQAEDYLNGKLTELPKDLEKFRVDYEGLRQHGRDNASSVFPEYAAAFREDLSQCGWFAKDAWLRVRFDVLVLNAAERHAVIIDLKTGQQRQEDRDQLSLFAFAAFLLFPEVDEVQTELWYSKNGGLVPMTYRRDGFIALRDQWLKKSAPMLADEEFLPTPNGLCGWCFARASNGGPCKFS